MFVPTPTNESTLVPRPGAMTRIGMPWGYHGPALSPPVPLGMNPPRSWKETWSPAAMHMWTGWKVLT